MRKHKKGTCKYKRCVTKCGTCTPGCDVCYLPSNRLTTECPGIKTIDPKIHQLIEKGIDFRNDKWEVNLDKRPEFQEGVKLYLITGHHAESDNFWIEKAFYSKEKCNNYFKE